jgi:hypothetical protein
VVARACQPNYRKLKEEVSLDKKPNPVSKITKGKKGKRARAVAQVIEYLLEFKPQYC